MHVMLFGASGMVGQAALRECLADADVTQVLSVGRSPAGQHHPKLREIVQPNLLDLSRIPRELTGYDACLFCLGASSVGMTEARYTSLTFDLTLSVARTLVSLNPGMTFIFVSGAGAGAGADSSEHGRIMWARVKGKAENALLRLPFKAAYRFRSGAMLRVARSGYSKPVLEGRTSTPFEGSTGLAEIWKGMYNSCHELSS